VEAVRDTVRYYGVETRIRKQHLDEVNGGRIPFEAGLDLFSKDYTDYKKEYEYYRKDYQYRV
jgi:hypothetical protein